jgi:hypothetical protein
VTPTRRNHKLWFRVTWLGWDTEPCDESEILAWDLSEAIAWAASRVEARQHAHGFHVQSVRLRNFVREVEETTRDA